MTIQPPVVIGGLLAVIAGTSWLLASVWREDIKPRWQPHIDVVTDWFLVTVGVVDRDVRRRFWRACRWAWFQGVMAKLWFGRHFKEGPDQWEE